MRVVTDRTSNPFGMRAPQFVDAGREAVYGYGDVDADFHAIGHYPGEHGGEETGVPFTGTAAGRRLQRVLHDVGLLAEPYSDQPEVSNLFLSYVHASVTPEGRPPTAAEYAELAGYFDAELRAINAHVLLPVGRHAIRHVLREYTTQLSKVDLDAVHATELRGRGFLVLPVSDPADWSDDDEAALADALRAVLARDYRQTKGVPTLVG